MEKQVLLDKLSEFLMVEQAGAQLYRVVAERALDADIRRRYEEFGLETQHHREVLVNLIEQLGGDPGYISPTARVAQIRGEQMLCLALEADGLSPEELELVDLESVALAETKDHADWAFLAMLAPQLGDPEQALVSEAVAEVGDEEETHLRWALDTLAEKAMVMTLRGPAPLPERWQSRWTGAHWTTDQHPAPITEDDGLLPPAMMEAWRDPVAVVAVRG